MRVDAETVRRALLERLPARARWLIDGTPLDWDFSLAAEPLRPLAQDDAKAWAQVLPVDWRDLLIFGARSYGEGGGACPFLAVNARSGAVIGLDIERGGGAAFFLSSSIDAFIETFLLFDRALTSGGDPPVDLGDKAGAIDPRGFDRSEWRDLADAGRADPARR